MMKKIYIESWAYFRAHMLLFLGSAVVIEALLAVLPSNSSNVSLLIIYSYLAFSVHRFFLKGEDHFSANQLRTRKNVKYGMKGSFKFSVAATLFGIVPAIFAFVIIMPILQNGTERRVLVLLVTLATLATYWIVLGFLGTLLPAIADSDPRYRLSAGIKLAHVTMWRLLVGPAFVGFLSMVLVIAVNGTLYKVFGTDRIVSSFIASALGTFTYFFNLILAASILCSVYRMIVPAAAAISK